MIAKKPPSKICFVESGFCYNLNQYPPIAWEPFVLEEGDVSNYTSLLTDAQAVVAIHEATKGISDRGARAALESGIAAAVKAIEKRGADREVKITLAG